jgi:hypothetical protein
MIYEGLPDPFSVSPPSRRSSSSSFVVLPRRSIMGIVGAIGSFRRDGIRRARPTVEFVAGTSHRHVSKLDWTEHTGVPWNRHAKHKQTPTSGTSKFML